MTKRVLILVEGQTEERFVKDLLAPTYWSTNLFLEPTLLVTKRVKDGPNFKGGVTNFGKFENDVKRLLNNSGGALVTTFLDYYALPNDFPGMQTRSKDWTGLQSVHHLESEMHRYFGSPQNFIPFLALHEFEALLFSDDHSLPSVMTATHKQTEFSLISKYFSTPEEINNSPLTAPSKRILNLFPAYRKTLHGPTTASRIGLERIRQSCPHFSSWLNALEKYAMRQT